uniref:Olfactory receptor n=1 Tax=Ursus americanus TaxID=9643 RepID=A0A452RCM5_URSAM
MKRQNQSSVVEFILLGFSNSPEFQEQLFGVFLVVYLVTLLGNAIIIVVISLEQSLHVPMYLFLQNLSVVDVSFSAAIMPEMLVVLSTQKTSISFISCFAQMYFILFFGGTECFLLGAMAYDRFAAICHPLSYPMLMNKRVFMKLLMMSWALGFMLGTVQTSWVVTFPFCGPNEINHISCETPAVLELACADTFCENLSFHHCHQHGRQKGPFPPVPPIFTSVTLFLCTANMTYLQPKSGYSPENQMKLIHCPTHSHTSAEIHDLQLAANSEMKKALVKLLGEEKWIHTHSNCAEKPCDIWSLFE